MSLSVMSNSWNNFHPPHAFIIYLYFPSEAVYKSFFPCGSGFSKYLSDNNPPPIKCKYRKYVQLFKLCIYYIHSVPYVNNFTSFFLQCFAILISGLRSINEYCTWFVEILIPRAEISFILNVSKFVRQSSPEWINCCFVLCNLIF